MIRKRGAPVLVELMRKQSPTHGTGSHTPAGPVHADHVPEPKVAPRPPRLTPDIQPDLNNSAVWGDAAPVASGKRDYRMLAIVAASVIALVALVAIISFSIGKKNAGDSWAKVNAGDTPEAPDGGGSTPPVIDPLNPTPAGPNGGLGAPFDGSNTPTPPGYGESPLQTGWNYLIVATLNRSDAELAGRFLADNNIPIQLVPADKVDPRSARANNGLWQVLVLRGVPGGEYKQRKPERDALIAQIQRLGKKWKAENKKAPTDFDAPYWVKYTK